MPTVDSLHPSSLHSEKDFRNSCMFVCLFVCLRHFSASTDSCSIQRQLLYFSGLLPYAAVGAAVGAGTVLVFPVILGAVGFTGAGVAAGSVAASIQSAVYGGSVASGSVFALLQSAGTASIATAGNTAIGGILGGIGASGARMFVCLN